MATVTKSAAPRADTGLDPYENPLPRERQGLFAIDEPVLNGVVQLLSLDKNWLIIANNTILDLFGRIDTLSSGELQTAFDTWTASVKAGNPNSSALNDIQDIRDTYIWQARTDIEGPLGVADKFNITSPDDPNYTILKKPSNATKVQVSAGGERLTPSHKNKGFTDMDWHIYSYLNMPFSLVDGKTYTIELTNPSFGNDGYTVTFLFDLNRTISRAIKVNQVGYLPSAGIKKAYMGCHLFAFDELDLSHATTFDVINVNTQVVAFSGPVTLVEAAPVFDAGAGGAKDEPMYGEDVYQMNFSAMTATGEFIIRVPGVGRSWPFGHKASVYSEAAYTSFRGLYHHRMGVPLEAAHTNWPRQQARLGPLYYESENFNRPRHLNNIENWNRFDVIGATINRGIATPELAGGYHDASDWDGKLVHLTATADLLVAYEWNTAAFSDDQFDIPESGNSIPDILDEARYGLELWRASQNGIGGVSGQLETWTHPKIDSELGSGDGPVATKTDYAFSTRTRWHSGIYAAIAAHYAQLIKPFDAGDAAIYEASAILAYNYCLDPANSVGIDFVINAGTKRGDPTGVPYTFEWTEDEDQKDVYLMWAKLRLFLLTSDATFITDAPSIASLEATSKEPWQTRFSRKDYSQWMYYSIIEADAAGAPGLSALATTYRNFFINDADDLVTDQTTGSSGSPLPAPYKQLVPRNKTNSLNFSVGAIFNMSRSLWIAHRITGLQNYKDRMIEATDMHFGCNSMGMSWVTGAGYVYPVFIQNQTAAKDGTDECIPGIPVYGITTGGVFGDFKKKVWQGVKDGWARSNYSVTSLTQVGGVATVITALPLLTWITSGIPMLMIDANEALFNVSGVMTVTGTNSFTYLVDPTTPATATGIPAFKPWFVASAQEENPPMWRRWMMNPELNVSQNEYTINESIAGNTFNTLMLLDAFESVDRPAIRKTKDLYGKWPLQ